MFFKILKISLSFLFFSILLFSGLLLYHFQAIEAQTVQYKLAGWFYSDTYGWISLNSDNLNSDNCQLPGCIESPVDYAVVLKPDNSISGYGWSSDVGWVCFGNGNGDDTKGCTGAVPSGTLTLTVDSNNGKLDGWAKIISLNDDGWIHFSRGGSTGPASGEECYDCKPVCVEWTQACSDDPPECHNVPPCLSYSKDFFDSCNTCFSETKFDLKKIPESAVDPVIGGSGYSCKVCTGNNTLNDPNQYCHKVLSANGTDYRIVCSNCPTCELYGGSTNLSDGGLLGWSWNGVSSADGDFGAGWIHLNTIGGSSGIVFPWLETQYGSIYTPEKVRQRGGSSGNNATYCIFASDILNVRSAYCEQAVKGVNIIFPTGTAEVYRNGLGKVDVDGLITPAVTNGIINKYGQGIVIIPEIWSGSKILDNKVYVREGNLTINESLGLLTFNNASPDNPNIRGNGTIVVRGNLIINSDIKYDTNFPANLNQLASVAWIVQGDVIINSVVKDIAGAFIVLGAAGSNCRYDNGNACDGSIIFPKYTQNGYGILFSVDPGASGDTSNYLTVSGLIVARAFDFRRTFSDSARGSEKIIYDGRLIANPPPGLGGFSEGLPVIRDFSY
ncbi:MAG: hypothetical protein WC610_01915 [Patescibacteria group bacterium]